ncbi:MAG TPA: putative toxin-antitoxin system toxin component, PIN family [Thermomicrobiales bacterium]|nr:putative toxin-antitoxin system toxin component, PIN family [Thermomicrobiales bacterium]
MTSGPGGSAVVDTNLLVSGLLRPEGQPRRLLRAWHERAFTLLVSPTLVAEYRRVLARPRLRVRYGLDPAAAAALLDQIERRGALVAPREPLPVAVRDPKDDMVLAAALGGPADYLITGDDDLLALAGDPRLGALRIVTVRAFLDILDAEPSS